MAEPALRIRPLRRSDWPTLVALFGARGACGGCWCMWWRLPRSQYNRQKGAGNRRAMKRLVDSRDAPGILAYRQGEPVGWCAVAPRQAYPVLARSRTLKPIDASPVWSVVCLFIRKDCRRQGVSVELLRAAARYVANRGGSLLEGYPIVPRTGQVPDAFAWTGLVSSYHRAGFTDCAAPSPTRRIVRLELAP